MVAEFYVIPESFAFNAALSVPEIENKIRLLANDIIYIKKYRDSNKFLVHYDIYEVNFLNGITLSQILGNVSVAREYFSRDAYNALLKIIIESKKTTISVNEVVQVLLPQHDENICHGLIAFEPMPGIHPQFQLIYNLTTWFNFRRYFLGLYPKNPFFFFDECVKYFPKLYFHERVRETIGDILDNCPKKIVYHLAALNDQFRSSQQQNLNRTQVLQHFSNTANLDETATLEGDAKRKARLTFKFKNSAGNVEDVCCEPHLKICYNDNHPGDSSYSTNKRIYFHEGRPLIHGGNILIGHIGLHL
jgi:hypothetical protein